MRKSGEHQQADAHFQGYLGLGKRYACQNALTLLLTLNPAHDKALLISHALVSGLFD